MKYRKPGSLNWVTFMLVGMAGVFVYLAVCLWPVYSTRSRVKGILLDHVPILYKANLRPAEVAANMIEDMKTSIRTELKKAGINEKGVKLFVKRDPKEIEMEARLKVKAHFRWLEKTYEFDLAPKVVSDATRVDW
jgi:hypothetical protein